jgi:hypothetical protein
MNHQKKLSAEKYIVQNGINLPFYECFINEDWKDQGMASVFISKTMPSGKYAIGMYNVDIYCLGLKSTVFRFSLNDLEYKELYETMASSVDSLVECDLNLAHNLIYGAIDYALELGISTDKDFEITRYLPEDNLIDDGIDEIEFGKDGKLFMFMVLMIMQNGL